MDRMIEFGVKNNKQIICLRNKTDKEKMKLKDILKKITNKDVSVTLTQK